jgi:hypothetical protein
MGWWAVVCGGWEPGSDFGFEFGLDDAVLIGDELCGDVFVQAGADDGVGADAEEACEPAEGHGATLGEVLCCGWWWESFDLIIGADEGCWGSLASGGVGLPVGAGIAAAAAPAPSAASAASAGLATIAGWAAGLVWTLAWCGAALLIAGLGRAVGALVWVCGLLAR